LVQLVVSLNPAEKKKKKKKKIHPKKTLSMVGWLVGLVVANVVARAKISKGVRRGVLFTMISNSTHSKFVSKLTWN
jgi:hypothetical protein